MIKKHLISLGFVLVAASVMMSCSVKEDRNHCPCRLCLDFSGVDTVAVPQVRLYLTTEDAFVENASYRTSTVFPEFVVSVPRTDVYVNVYGSDEGLLQPDKGLVIPYGQDCPRLFSFSSKVDARNEVSRVRVGLHKNHCVMTVVIRKNNELDYGLCIKGNICGYRADGSPMEGRFSYIPSADESGGYSAVLPRQVDSSLMLEVDDSTGVIKEFALGEYISAGGYDWNAEDLEDVEVIIDWAQTSVLLTVQGWDWVKEYEIVI